MVVRLLAIRGEPNQIFRFLFISPPAVTDRLAESFRRTTYSFRKLSIKKAAQILPHRLSIQKRRGANLKDLVAQMQVDSHADSWFELLNGLVSGRRFNADDTVRLVV